MIDVIVIFTPTLSALKFWRKFRHLIAFRRFRVLAMCCCGGGEGSSHPLVLSHVFHKNWSTIRPPHILQATDGKCTMTTRNHQQTGDDGAQHESRIESYTRSLLADHIWHPAHCGDHDKYEKTPRILLFRDMQ